MLLLNRSWTTTTTTDKRSYSTEVELLLKIKCSYLQITIRHYCRWILLLSSSSFHLLQPQVLSTDIANSKFTIKVLINWPICSYIAALNKLTSSSSFHLLQPQVLSTDITKLNLRKCSISFSTTNVDHKFHYIQINNC